MRVPAKMQLRTVTEKEKVSRQAGEWKASSTGVSDSIQHRSGATEIQGTE